MVSNAKRRILLETLQTIIFGLNDDEMSEIAKIIYKALERLEKESEE